jgi:hypothetical protein
MASTSSLPLLHVWTKCDVFLSFGGTNTRKSLTSHLYHALCQNQIDACIAYKLDGGDRPSLSSWKWLKSHIFRSSFSPKIMQILYFLWGNSPRLLSAWRTNDRWFYLFSTKLFQAMFKIWLGAMEMHFASMKDNAHVIYDEISLVLVAYFTCCLACLCSWFIMHCMQGWDQAN